MAKIQTYTEKTALADDDLFVIADSAAANGTKKVKASTVWKTNLITDKGADMLIDQASSGMTITLSTSDDDLILDSGADLNLLADGNINITSDNDVVITTDNTGDINLTSDGDVNIVVGANLTMGGVTGKSGTIDSAFFTGGGSIEFSNGILTLITP